jgi:RNA polymerase sigma-70 factor, ECF subfamily
VAAEYGQALARLARVYETDAEKRRDLLQDIHMELWRSLSTFAGQCSLRTWVYRVAHNVCISRRLRKPKPHLVSLQEIAELAAPDIENLVATEAATVARLYTLIRQLTPPDDQVMQLYLEDMDASSIGTITGLSPTAVAIRVHRIKSILARQFRAASMSGDRNDRYQGHLESTAGRDPEAADTP